MPTMSATKQYGLFVFEQRRHAHVFTSRCHGCGVTATELSGREGVIANLPVGWIGCGDNGCDIETWCEQCALERRHEAHVRQQHAAQRTSSNRKPVVPEGTEPTKVLA